MATATEEHAKRIMRQASETTGDAASMQSTRACTQRTCSATEASSSAVSSACEAPPSVFPPLSFSVFNAPGELTFDFARRAPAETAPSGFPTISGVFQSIMNMTTLPDFPQTTFLPMDVSTNDFVSTLPSLSEALRFNRTFGDAMVPERDDVSLTTPPKTTTTTISASDWDEILGCSETMEEYVSPDVAQYFENQQTLQGSQDLDMTGREFLGSPAIPVVGTVPRTFGDLIVPVQLNHAAPQPPAHPPMRYALREKPRPTQVYPLFHSLTLAAQQASAALQPLTLKGKHVGKSARTRLFSSPEGEGQENVPPNTIAHGNLGKKRQVPPKPVAKSVPKTTQPRERRSLDSATPESVPPPPTSTLSTSTRKSKDCLVIGCTKGARSKGLCKRHGGGKRCSFDGCTRSDQGGGRCISHGGGRRCAVTHCKNSAQSRGLCKSHGGGKRCTFAGCLKSCQGGGRCREHGGVRLCKTPVCFNYRHSGGHCRSHADSPAASGDASS